MIKINLIQQIKFFTPTTELKELVILEHIESNPDTTQKELSKIANAATSMINVYINDYEKKGYIVREYISTKVVKYRITSKGLHRKNYLLITYLHELLKLYRLAKENVEKFLQGLEDKGYRNILLYGAGEAAETILSVIRDRDTFKLNIVAVIDDNKDLQGMELLENKIISSDKIKDYKHSVIVITSYTYENDIRNRLNQLGYPKDKVVKFFSQ